MRDNPTVTVLVLVEAGSKYETKEENGLSHFLEHMCFKGTTKRKTSMDITHELDSIGSQYNAFTSNEYTGYYAKAQARHAPLILDIISDIYLNSTLPEVEMEKEKGVIIEEISMYNDLPQRKVQDVFMKLLYGDQPAGWDTAGKKEIITRLMRKDFVKYHQHHYVAPKIIVVISGMIESNEVVKKIKKAVVIGPSHYQSFNNTSTTNKKYFETPLGKILTFNTDFIQGDNFLIVLLRF